MTPALQNLIFAAMHEVALTTGVAAKLDHETDEAPVVLPSLMARIRTLSEAVAAVITQDFESMPLDEFWFTVHGEPPSADQLEALLATSKDEETAHV